MRELENLRQELRRVERERDFLAAKVEALEAGGGEISNFTSPNSGPYSGKPVLLWMIGPGWWPDAQVWRDGVFVQPVDGGLEICGSAQQHAKLWRPV